MASLEKAPYEIDLVKVSQLWQKNTIVTSYLNECAKDALRKTRLCQVLTVSSMPPGEAEWTVNQAREEGVYAENIDQSLDFRRRSKLIKMLALLLLRGWSQLCAANSAATP